MKNIIGIYKIISPSGKIYIGQSVDIKKRWTAYKYYDRDYECYKNRNKDSLILKSLKKYGYDNHVFEIIEECNLEELNYKEIYYIEKYKSCIIKYRDKNGLNLHIGGNTPPVRNRKLTYEEREKISKSKYKIINKILNGNVIREYESISQMIECENFSYTKFRNNFYEFNKSFIDDFIFSFKDKNDFKFKIKFKKIKSNKNYYNKKDKEHVSNVRRNIALSIRSREEWSEYFKNINSGRTHHNRKKPIVSDKMLNHLNKVHDKNKIKVDQYDLDGNYLRSFNSMKDASDFVNGKYQSIYRVCKGIRNKAYGYKWKYSK